jgi:hypothetical protein
VSRYEWDPTKALTEELDRRAARRAAQEKEDQRRAMDEQASEMLRSRAVFLDVQGEIGLR